MTVALFAERAITANLMSDLHHRRNHNSIRITILLVSKMLFAKEAGLIPKAKPQFDTTFLTVTAKLWFIVLYNQKVKCHVRAGNLVLLASVFDLLQNRAVCYKRITLIYYNVI